MSRNLEALVVATGNRGKLEEFRRAFAARERPPRLLAADEAGLGTFPPETGETYEANALIKARYAAERSGLPSLGDDSGLEVAALGGAPGVLSARYGGEATNEARVARLLEALKDVPNGSRSARFVCSLVLALPGGETHSFWGACEGEITREVQGESGFGYDPVFYSYDLNQTFAQAPAEAKARVSHRARALAELNAWLIG